MKKYFYFIVLFFVSFLLTFNFALAEEKELLRFIQISDTHINYEYLEDKAKLRGSSEKILRKAIEQINNLENVDFVIATGDLIDKPQEELLNKFVEVTMLLNPPFYVILGNHDVGVNTKLSKKEFIKKFYELPNPRSFANKKSYYSFSPKEGLLVICLDTTNEEVVTRLGRIDDEQLFWLQNELERNNDKIIIIALHVSPVDPLQEGQDMFFESSRRKFLNIVNNHKNVIGVFSGDYHIARIFKEKGKVYAVTPASIKFPCAFREIIVSEKIGSKKMFGKLKPKRIIYVDFKWHVINEPELIAKSRSTSLNWKTAIGEEKDREGRVKIKAP